MMFLFSSLGWAQKEARELAYSNWGVNVEPSVVTKAFSKEAVRDFLGAMYFKANTSDSLLGLDIREGTIEDLEWGEVYDLRNRLPAALGTVGAFKWADVDVDGVYELLVTRDNSGREFYNNLYIVKQIAGGYRRQHIEINNAKEFGESLDARMAVFDLDQDGMLELILPIEIGSYRGAAPTPNWTSIYKWKRGGFIESDDRFKDFYSEILLPNVDKKIEELSRGKSEAEQDLDERLMSIWVIKDKIIRLLGIDPQAGLQRATKWANSPNPNVRENAVITLSDIPGVEATRLLEALSADPYYSVNIRAQRGLKKRSERAKE